MKLARRLTQVEAASNQCHKKVLPPKKDMDSGWAWVVLSATFTTFFATCGLGYNMGIYFVSFLEAFQESRSYTAWIIAVYAGVFQISGPLSSLLLPCIGARWVLVLGGILTAIDYGFLSISTSVLEAIVLQGIFGGIGHLLLISGSVAANVQYFNKRLYVASGIMFSGGGMGITMLGLFMEFLIEVYGWRGSLIILCGLSLQLCVCGTLVYNNTVKESNRPEVKHLINFEEDEVVKAETVLKTSISSEDGHSIKLFRQLFFKDISFWLLVGVFTTTQIASSSVYFFSKDILISKGFGSSFKIFITCVGISSTIGRLFSGMLTSYINPFLFNFIVGSMCAASVFLMTNIYDQWTIITIACIFGMGHGILCVLQTLIIAHVFGQEQMPIIWGYAMGVAGMGTILGPPLGGFIADHTGRYDGSIWLFSATFLLSAIISLILYIISRLKMEKLKSSPLPNDSKLPPSDANCLPAFS